MGGPLTGLLGLILLATCPLYYGHMFMNPKDAPFATAMTILLLGLVRAIDEYPRPRIITVIVFGMGLGLSIGSRILGGISALYVLAPLAMIISGEARAVGVAKAATNFGRFLLALFPGLIIGYGVMALLWPWSVIEPLNPLRAVAYFSEFFEQPWREMFGGKQSRFRTCRRNYGSSAVFVEIAGNSLVLSIAGIAAALVNVARSQMSLRYRAALIWWQPQQFYRSSLPS